LVDIDDDDRVGVLWIEEAPTIVFCVATRWRGVVVAVVVVVNDENKVLLLTLAWIRPKVNACVVEVHTKATQTKRTYLIIVLDGRRRSTTAVATATAATNGVLGIVNTPTTTFGSSFLQSFGHRYPYRYSNSQVNPCTGKAGVVLVTYDQRASFSVIDCLGGIGRN
jgi:hypothetical protein